MDITTEAVRLGLDLAQVRAEIAGANIARANVPGATMQRADFASALDALAAAERGDAGAGTRMQAISQQSLRGEIEQSGADDAASQDDQVAELSIQGLAYRALTDGLSRHFGLMQLAISGK
jgi:flagellar basal body rod protein FlgB